VYVRRQRAGLRVMASRRRFRARQLVPLGLEVARARQAMAPGRGAWWKAGAAHRQAAVTPRGLAEGGHSCIDSSNGGTWRGPREPPWTALYAWGCGRTGGASCPPPQFVVLYNGMRAGAEVMREELYQSLKTELRLELSSRLLKNYFRPSNWA
jgi:hypothetical protein